MAVQNVAPSKLKTAFKKSRTIGPLSTGGPVAITLDGTRLVTTVAEDVLLTNIENGLEICRFVGDTEAVNSLCITPSGSHLIVFTASLSLRIYQLPPASSEPLKQRVPPIRVVGRAHDAPIHVCKADPTSTYLASGSADGVVKVWDILRGFVTHVLKGHGGVVSALAWNYPRDAGSMTQAKSMHLITASVDTRIRVFNLIGGPTTSTGGGKPEAVLEGHVSVPRGLDVSSDGRWLVSGGRDSVVLVWDLKPGSGDSSGDSSKAVAGKKGKHKGSGVVPTLVRTLPTLERVEAVGLLSPDENVAGSTGKVDGLRFYTGGEKGVVRIWDARQGEVLQTFGEEAESPSEDMEEQRQIVDVIYLPLTSTLISTHADQNIMFYSLRSNALARQMIGYNDEIVDAAYLSYPSSGSTPSKDSHIAFATNSSLIRVYSTKTLDARLLQGHSEIVLALDGSADGTMLASGSKDKTARVWAPSPESSGDSWSYKCIAICEGHAESVGAVAMARTGDGPKFLFTGSQDKTIKMWDLSTLPTLPKRNAKNEDDDNQDSPPKCKSLTTLKAHDKDINSLDVSPNDRFLVSGSQDRTAKVYEIIYVPSFSGSRGELKLLGTCKGHKRGVWTVRFSSAERVLATGSGDKTIKLWSLDDYSCLKTFEGHTNSVLRVDFVNAGMQLVSTASDGLVKLWNVKDEECVTTLDNHEDKVWALAISSDERTVVSGAADSVVTFWEDCTEEQEAETEAKRADLVLKDQDFQNYLALHDYKRAIELALAMSQPGRLFSLFKKVTTAEDHGAMNSLLTGHKGVDEVLRRLQGPDLAKLLRYVRDWNTSGKSSSVAQRVLYAIFKLRTAEEIMKAFDQETVETKYVQGEDDFEGESTPAQSGSTILKELTDALIPYSERHLSRMEKLVQDSYMIDYILSEMDGGIFDPDIMDDDDAMDVDATHPVSA